MVAISTSYLYYLCVYWLFAVSPLSFWTPYFNKKIVPCMTLVSYLYPGLPSQLFFAAVDFYGCNKSCEGRPGYEASMTLCKVIPPCTQLQSNFTLSVI